MLVDPEKDPLYRAWLERWAKEVKSDCCTGVPDFNRLCCLQHDYCYQTHTDPREAFKGKTVPMTRSQSDALFRQCNQEESFFKKLSPMALWRWAGVRIGGRCAWNKGGKVDK